jgi:hypothetical protein
VSFQLRLYETSGDVAFIYHKVNTASAIYANGTSATIGFGAANGQPAQTFHFNRPNVTDGTGRGWTSGAYRDCYCCCSASAV